MKNKIMLSLIALGLCASAHSYAEWNVLDIITSIIWPQYAAGRAAIDALAEREKQIEGQYTADDLSYTHSWPVG